MEVLNGRTTVWVPKEEFESVQRLWKPEFTWIPVPVDRSLPPDHIAYIETNGPVSPLPPFHRPPKTPLSPLSPRAPAPKTPRTPITLAPLDTASLPAASPEYFGGSAELDTPELETAITTGFSPGVSDTPSTPSTATEPGSPSTPHDVVGPELSSPKIWRQSRRQSRRQSKMFSGQQAGDGIAKTISAPPEVVVQVPELRLERPQLSQLPQQNYAADPWKMYENTGDKWKMVDHRIDYRPAQPGLKQASWKRLSGKRDVKMNDHWQTYKRDEAHWNGSKKGFAVRLEVNLELEVEIKGFVNGDITLSAEALHFDIGKTPLWM